MPEACDVVYKIMKMDTLHLSMGASTFTFALNVMLVVFFIGCELLLYRNQANGECLIAKKPMINVTWMIILLLVLAMFGVTSDNFVYFQF